MEDWWDTILLSFTLLVLKINYSCLKINVSFRTQTWYHQAIYRVHEAAPTAAVSLSF